MMARNPGRVAGLWYLALVLLGPIRLMYIPGKLFAADNAATVSNIAAHGMLFRTGVAANLACSVILIFLTLAFYRLFESVDRHLAVLVVILGGIMPALIDFVSVVNDLAVLMTIHGDDLEPAFNQAQRDAFVALFLDLRNLQNTAAEILWGAWLFPLGLLVLRSRLIPRLIGIWLLVNGAAYIAISLTGIFAPQYQGAVFHFSFPALLGEIAIMLWLLVFGPKPTEPHPAS
jgi:Domain of unknown function (DUF4386)